MYPSASLVETITTDRMRKAETARGARADTRPPAPRRSRRLRTLATRVTAFATLR
jgi:hypothetical protein